MVLLPNMKLFAIDDANVEESRMKMMGGIRRGERAECLNFLQVQTGFSLSSSSSSNMPLSFDTYLDQMNFMAHVQQLNYNQLMDSCNPVFS